MGKKNKTVLQLDDYLGPGKPGFNPPSAPGSLRAHQAASLHLHPYPPERVEHQELCCFSLGEKKEKRKKVKQKKKKESLQLLMKDNMEQRKQIYPRANVT